MINKFKINLNTVDKVKEFCTIASKIEADLDIIVGRYIIDAKSIMGIFSVDISKDLILRIASDDIDECNKIKEKLLKFIVEE